MAGDSLEAQGCVIRLLKLAQRMIKEVERRNPELNILPLRELEVFVERQIAIDISRSTQIGPDVRTVPTDLGGNREAAWVEALSVAQATLRIAGEVRHQRSGTVFCPKDSQAADGKAGPQVAGGQRLKRWAK